MRKPLALKDHTRERRTFVNRVIVAFILVLLLLGVLLGRMLYLQVGQYEVYRTLSDQNRVQLQPVPPTRGLIYDRNGILLADNRPSYNLTLVKEQVQNLEQTLLDLQALISISERDIERFTKRLRQGRRPYQSVPLKFQLSEQEIARISVNFHALPGVQIEAELIRYYPYGEELVHALGYVGRINERELQEVDARNYSATHHIGKLGVEKYYEDLLHGQVGMQKVETNARGRVLRVLERVDPQPGKDLILSLDLKLQQAAMAALGDRRGAVVALDPATGGILALVSQPGYDPNLFVTGISSKNYQALRESEDLPLFNRAIRGRYPPASTIKPVIGLSALESGVVSSSYRIYDPGWYQINAAGRFYRDWKRGGHGWVDLRRAIIESCDTWFYDVSHKMGVDPMSDMLGKFGFGQVTSLDLPEAHAAILPSREWKRRTRRTPWYPGDSINLSIGQGFMVATPLQLATATMVLANRGEWKQPKMLQQFVGEEPLPAVVEPGQVPDPVVLKNAANWEYIVRSMEMVVHSDHGTARRIGEGISYQIAGKTGTAQVLGIKQDERYDAEKLAERHRDHALFVGFAPAKDPRIAVAVVVENGGSGSGTAAPVARQLFDAMLAPVPAGELISEH